MSEGFVWGVGTVVFVTCVIDSFYQSFFQAHIIPQIVSNYLVNIIFNSSSND